MYDYNKSLSELNESTLIREKKLKEVFTTVTEDLNELTKLWKRIGFKENKLNDRTEDFINAIYELIDGLKDGEYELENNIEISIKNYKNKVDELIQRLNLDINKLNINKNTNNNNRNDKLSLIEEEQYYKDLLDKFENIKLERKKKFNELKIKERELCNLLNENSYTINDVSAIAENELENLENHIICLAKEKQRRILLLKQYQDDVLKTINDTGLDIPFNSVLNDLIEWKTFDELHCDNDYVDAIRYSIDKFKKRHVEMVLKIDQLRKKIVDMWAKLNISNESIKSYLTIENGYNQNILSILDEEYNRCIEIKKENLGNFINSIRLEINDYWTKCYYSKNECNKFDAYFTDVKNDDILEEHELYLIKLKSYYEENSDIFSIINEWINMWNKFTNFEQEYSDPNRFKSRHYSSLTEERERKKFNTELPKLEANVLKKINLIEQSQNRTIFIYGAKIADFIKEKKEAYNAEKEEQRKKKQIKKDLDLKHEAHFGSFTSTLKPLTPVNRLKGKTIKDIATSPAKKLIHTSAVTSPSTMILKVKTSNKYSLSNTSSAIKNNLHNKENLFKRSSYFKKNNINNNSNNLTPIKKTQLTNTQMNLMQSSINKKRTSIKSLNEKFKRRSKHLYQKKTPTITIKKSISKLEFQKEINLSQTDGNESGIYAGGSGSSTSNSNVDIETKSKLPKIQIDKAELIDSDCGVEDNYECDDIEFKDNDFISSTLLLES